uniref:Sodium/calcium exchanger membrane region domain-containing protein n=1 Tax=Hyaloperonospora arabidopsidis (strain Emoy2) TaxID=559515 RepID=M4BR74_HYAAE
MLQLSRELLFASGALALAAAVSDPVDSSNGSSLSTTYDCSDPSSSRQNFIDYNHLVYCNPLLQSSPVLGKAVLVLCLVLLLYLLSSTADEFFCPVLQAIVEKYRVPPHVAGVTFLSFGNGSPDVFSNIAAFATPTPSIGITSVLGGGLLVTTVYVVVVFSDEHLAAYFFPVKVHTEESMYAALNNEDDVDCWSPSIVSAKSAESTPLALPVHAEEPHLQQPQEQQKRRPYMKSQTTPIYDTFVRSRIFSDSDQSEPSPRFLDRLMYRKSSVVTPRSTPHISDALEPNEGQSLLEVTDVHLKRPSTMCVASMQESLRRMRRQRRRRKTAWESLETSACYGAAARRWTRGYRTLSNIDEYEPSAETEELDTEMKETADLYEEDVKRKELDLEAAEMEQLALEAFTSGSFISHAKIKAKQCWRMATRAVGCIYWTLERVVWNPFAVFTVFVRRLTIPLVDEDTWDKHLVVICPPFAMLLFGVSVFSFSINDPVFFVLAAVAGGTISGLIEYATSPLSPPEGKLLAPFICVAFVMSVIWIMNIANEVLAVLETLGDLFGISSSVLGVSVLAWGNSIGDLVSNMAIARDGFPTMAFAGCFAGPMFNLLVGVGLSLTIAIISRGPLSIATPSPVAYLVFGYLLLSLVLNIAVVSYDGFRYRPRLCYTLLALYGSFAIISVALVANYPEK